MTFLDGVGCINRISLETRHFDAPDRVSAPHAVSLPLSAAAWAAGPACALLGDRETARADVVPVE